MSHRIEGTKVVLRPIELSDIERIKEWNEMDNEVDIYNGPWYDGSGHSKWLKNKKKELKKGNPEKKPFWDFALDTKKDKPIGTVNVNYYSDDPHCTEIGICIEEDSYLNKGLGTEALALLLDYLFLEQELTRVGFTTWSGNPRMIRVGEKLGFKIEVKIRKCIFVFDDFYDKVKMGILNKEWEKVRRKVFPEIR